MDNQPTNASKGNILVVDDTPANLRLLVQILTDKGYKVRPAPNGQLALSGTKVSAPDLILLDIKMPDMDGYEVCEHLKADESTRDIPVIFISALDEVFDKLKAFSVGGVDYVTKPFQTEEVLARIETHLAIRNLQKSLEAKNEQLSKTLEELQTTQAQLIESEKMAALGNLVAGVAHEINTPVGSAMTAASILQNRTKSFQASVEEGQLKKSVLKAYLHTVIESTDIIFSNLHQTGELVQSFKLVAVDQMTLKRRNFKLKKYLEESLLSLEPLIKQNNHNLSVIGDDNLTIDSYPGAFFQIISNLVMNSLTHAYQPEESGNLCFELTSHQDKAIVQYSDDGCGILPENIGKIFEPFFTTARHKGGSGLGLHIVYNLVTQKLKGTIVCESKVGLGTKFILELPIELPEQPDFNAELNNHLQYEIPNL